MNQMKYDQSFFPTDLQEPDASLFPVLLNIPDETQDYDIRFLP